MLVIRRVVGESMLPKLRSNSIIVGVKSKNINIGDIVVARQNNKEVIKRVKEIADNQYYLVGDNFIKSVDSGTYGLVKQRNIIGKVYFVL